MKKSIPKIREREGNVKIYSHNSVTEIRCLGCEWTGTGIPVICCPTTRSLCCSFSLFVLIFSGGGGVGSQGGGGGQEPHRWGVHALVRPGELVAHFAELAFLEGCPGGQQPW